MALLSPSLSARIAVQSARKNAYCAVIQLASRPASARQRKWAVLSATTSRHPFGYMMLIKDSVCDAN